MQPVLIASHNLMHGLRLPALIPHYVALREERGLDLLCLQEDRFLTEGDDLPSTGSRRRSAPIQRGAERRLSGPRLRHRHANARVRRAIDRPAPAAGGAERVRTPLHRGREDQAEIRCCSPSCARGPAARRSRPAASTWTPRAVTRHRATQVEAIAGALRERNLHRAFVACGDTNAFALRRQPEALQALLAPLAALGAVDPGTRPTHYFARQNEPKLPHRTGVLLGKLGIDLPRRYDVVCTNLPAPERGQVVTPDSDHDLVWARIAPG